MEVELVDGEALSDDNVEQVLGDASGILVPGGFGKRAFDGKIAAARYARTHKIPYLGICLGMQSPCVSSHATCLAMRTRVRPSSIRNARMPSSTFSMSRRA